NDMRAIQDAAARGDERARLALDVFVHRLAKAVAGLVTSLERLDALIFTGGLGGNNAVFPGPVLAPLRFLRPTRGPRAPPPPGGRPGARSTAPARARPPGGPPAGGPRTPPAPPRLIAARSGSQPRS